MNSSKKAIAKTTKDGYIQVAIAQPPGCLARLEAWARAAAWAGVWFALGVVVGLMVRGF